MFAKATKVKLLQPVDFTVAEKDEERLHYWRKHPNLHGWMQQLYLLKGGKDTDFNLSPVVLDRFDLDALELFVRAGRLPETSGFFFGASDGSERDDDLDFIQKARAAIVNGKTVYYVAWW